MAKPTLLPDPTCLHLQLLDASETTITAVVTTTSQEAECPLCHGRSAQIHSRYVRSVADLPWMACAVRLELHVRRFFCQPEEQAPTPRVLGVDDFSFCKRKSYGTILLDLERRIPIDILPNREAATLAKWLKEHEGVEIISRDRGGPYAEGATSGAPHAQQVADRWHLLANLSETLQPFFSRKQAQLKALVQRPSETFSAEEEQQLPAWYHGQTKRKTKMYETHHQERVARYHKVHELRAEASPDYLDRPSDGPLAPNGAYVSENGASSGTEDGKTEWISD